LFVLFGPAALLLPLSEFTLFPVSDPTARGDEPVVPVGRSTAVPVEVVPGVVTPVPIEFICGAFGFAPVWAKADPLISAAAAVIKSNFFIEFPRWI
jgi:hypothetical protein